MNWINASVNIKDVKIDGLTHSLSEIFEFCDGSLIPEDAIQFLSDYSINDEVHFEDLRGVLMAIIYVDKHMDNIDSNDYE